MKDVHCFWYGHLGLQFISKTIFVYCFTVCEGIDECIWWCKHINRGWWGKKRKIKKKLLSRKSSVFIIKSHFSQFQRKFLSLLQHHSVSSTFHRSPWSRKPSEGRVISCTIRGNSAPLSMASLHKLYFLLQLHKDSWEAAYTTKAYFWDLNIWDLKTKCTEYLNKQIFVLKVCRKTDKCSLNI